MAHKKYSLDELPAKIRLTVSQNESGYLAIGLLVLGLGTAAVGGVFMLFGPDQVYVSPNLDLIKFLQLYPGPITGVGGVLASIGGYVGRQAVNRQQEAIQRQLQEQLAFTADEIPAGKQLHAIPLEDDFYELRLGDAQPGPLEVIQP